MVTCLALFILKIILWGEYEYPFILVHGLAASPRAFRCTHMQRLMLKWPVFLNCSPAYCLRKGLSLNLEFTPSARLVGQQVSKNCLHIPRFYMDPGDPNSILTVHEKPLTLWDSSLQLPPLQESQGVSLGSSRMKMMEQNWQEWGRDFRDDARRQDPSSLKTVSTLSAWSWFGKDWIATCHRHLQEDSSCLGDETAVLQAHISTWRYAQRLAKRLAALAKEPHLIPSTYTVTYSSRSKGSDIFFWPPQAPGMHMAHIHTCMQIFICQNF